MSPPTLSMVSAMSRADSFSVPLNSRCSRKCDAPAIVMSSSREPVATQKPAVTDRTSGMRSVTTVRPLSRHVDWINVPYPAMSEFEAAGCGERIISERLSASAPARVPTGATLATAAALAGACIGGAEVAELLPGLLLEEILERRRGTRRNVRRTRRNVRRTCFDGTRRTTRRRRVRAVVGAGRRRSLISDEAQTDFALRIDVVDTHLELVAQV